jgi:hypothetical protein
MLLSSRRAQKRTKVEGESPMARFRHILISVPAVVLALLVPLSLAGAAQYADPAFQQQWSQGEAITPNFWGPLTTARDGQQEQYKEAQGGQRLVQYFDKGRMELTNGTVTNGLLATELTKGQLQLGDATFQPKDPPQIAIAGDPDNPGPTYAQLASIARSLFDAAPVRTGGYVQATVSAAGAIAIGDTGATDPSTFVLFDDPTKHNVPRAFADYRLTAGLLTIGYALCEPFTATVKVAGQQRTVLVQVFERRVLTYTASNPAAFQVEMGNIGQHYYQWRYSAGTASTTSTSTATTNSATGSATAASTPRATSAATPSATASSTTSNTSGSTSGSGAPAAPPASGQYDMAVSVADASPPVNGKVTVSATLTRGGQPVPGTTVRATWKTGGTDHECTGGPSGSDGVVTCSGDVGGATSGQEVRVDFFVTDQSNIFGKSAYFTPR